MDKLYLTNTVFSFSFIWTKAIKNKPNTEPETLNLFQPLSKSSSCYKRMSIYKVQNQVQHRGWKKQRT